MLRRRPAGHDLGVPSFQRVQRSSYTPAARRHTDRLRRQQHAGRRDGHDPPQSVGGTLALAAGGAQAPYQLARARVSSERPSGLGPRGAGATDARINSQPDRLVSGDVIRQQTGGQDRPALARRRSSVDLAVGQRPDNQERLRRRRRKSAGGRRQQMVGGSDGVAAAAGAVRTAASQRKMGSVLRGRVRLAPQRAATSVLVKVPGPGLVSTGGRFPQIMDRRESVAVSPARDFAASAAEGQGGQVPDSNASGAGLAHAAVVAASVAVVSAGSSARRVSPRVSPSDTQRRGAASSVEAARSVLENGCVQALRDSLEQQGFSAAAVNRIVNPWENSSAKLTLSRHRQLWNNHWIPFCEQAGVDPYTYSVPNLVNFLEFVQQKSARYAAANDKPEQHASFKHARAAIGAIWRLIHPQQPRAADHPHVKAMSDSLRVTAPILTKYEETISLESLFAYLIKLACTGMAFYSMPLSPGERERRASVRGKILEVICGILTTTTQRLRCAVFVLR
eukprot:SAG11_NODE_51_length_19848_cov_37.780698_6_plen_507_part_00